MHDRFTRGFTAGVLGGLLSSAWNLSSFYLNFSNLRYLDFAAIMTYGRKTRTLWETIFSFFSTIFVYGLLGIIFIYLVTFITSENLLFKGFLFGVTSWFIFYSITLLFKIPELSRISFLTTLANFIGAVIYGIAMAFFLKVLDKIRT
jgi:hypothetical protein